MAQAPALLLASERQELESIVNKLARRLHNRDSKTLYEDILKEVHTVARRTLDDVRIQSTGSQLPAELLCYTFAFLPFRDIVCASGVCSLWKKITQGDPRLWTCISTRSGDGNTVLPVFLERGHQLPVALDINLQQPQTALGSSLAPHIWRMRELTISSNLSVDAVVASGLFDDALSRPAPNLRRFTLRLGWDAGYEIAFDYWFFVGQAPMLEELWLDVGCQPVLSAFSGLRIVVLPRVEHQDFKLAWQVLSSCPLLEHAAMRVDRAVDDQLSSTAPLPPLRALQSLRFDIDRADEGVTTQDGSLLLSILRPEVRARVDVTLRPVAVPHDLPTGADIILVTNSPSRPVPKFNMHARGKGRPARNFLHASLEHALNFLGEQLAVSADRLQELTVPAWPLAFLVLPTGVRFSNLRSYTVILPHRHVVFTEHGAHLQLERMPALQTFALTRGPGTKALSSDVLVDSDAVLGCFAVRRAGLDRIGRMVLRGVETRLTGGDVQRYVGELVREPWGYVASTSQFDRMDRWLFTNQYV